jgi:hypothetical protein
MEVVDSFMIMGSVGGGEFLGLLSNYQFLKKGSVLLNYGVTLQGF